MSWHVQWKALEDRIIVDGNKTVVFNKNWLQILRLKRHTFYMPFFIGMIKKNHKSDKLMVANENTSHLSFATLIVLTDKFIVKPTFLLH